MILISFLNAYDKNRQKNTIKFALGDYQKPIIAILKQYTQTPAYQPDQKYCADATFNYTNYIINTTRKSNTKRKISQNPGGSYKARMFTFFFCLFGVVLLKLPKYQNNKIRWQSCSTFYVF